MYGFACGLVEKTVSRFTHRAHRPYSYDKAIFIDVQFFMSNCCTCKLNPQCTIWEGEILKFSTFKRCCSGTLVPRTILEDFAHCFESTRRVFLYPRIDCILRDLHLDRRPEVFYRNGELRRIAEWLSQSPATRIQPVFFWFPGRSQISLICSKVPVVFRS